MIKKLRMFSRGWRLFVTTAFWAVTFHSHAGSVKATEQGVVIDSHLHVVSPGNWDASPLKAMGFLNEPPTGEKVLELMDEAGIDQAVLVSTAYLYPDPQESRYENDYVAALVKAHPQRFVGLCAISPLQPWAMEELDRCAGVPEFSGLKLHLFANPMNLTVPEDATTITTIFRKVAEIERRFPVLIDFNWMDDAQILALIQMAVASPEVNIIMAHALGHHYKEFVNVDSFKQILKGALDNLYVDISGTLLTYPPGSPSFEDYIWHLRKMGTDHILFGSDYPAAMPDLSYKAFTNMGFTADEQKQILGENAAKLFGMKN